MDFGFFPFEPFWWAIAGLVYLLVPRYRRYKHADWSSKKTREVAAELFAWVVCFTGAIVIIVFVYRAHHP